MFGQYFLFFIFVAVLLKFLSGKFPRIYKRVWAFVLNRIMGSIHAALKTKKEILFSELDTAKEKNSTEPFTILEIGVGTGFNFKFYPNDSNVVGLDPNDFFEKYVNDHLKSCPGINFKKFIKGVPEDLSALETSSFDAVVCTFVLCSVGDVEKSLQEIKRVLKPGGVFLFLEHVAAEERSLLLRAQNLVNPLWGQIFDGCHVNRTTGASIERAGFRQCHVDPFPMPLKGFPMVMIKSLIMGSATK